MEFSQKQVSGDTADIKDEVPQHGAVSPDSDQLINASRKVALVPKEQAEAGGKEHAVICTPACLSRKYTFLREIGRGNQGKVYEAIRQSDGRHVAIKQLQIRAVSGWKEYDLFQREIQMLSNLEMPGVATFYEAVESFEEANPSAYIVQEFLEGRSLEDMLHGGYRFTLNQVFQIGAKLIALLDRLHRHDPQVIHRDIKPSNIMLKHVGADDFEVYLIDFGAVANPQVQGGGSTVAGTYGYMPPEQLMGRPEPASDVYALAATLVRLLSGEEPDKMQVVDYRLMIEPHLPNVPRTAIQVLQGMLEPSPERRLHDEKLLEQVFLEFANGHYDIANKAEYVTAFGNNKGKYASLEAWDAALRDVKKYAQPGNIDLWMRMPEATPREELPVCYRKYAHLTKLDLIQKIFSCFDPSKAGGIFAIVGFIAKLIIGASLVTFLASFFLSSASSDPLIAIFPIVVVILACVVGWFVLSCVLILIFGWRPSHEIRYQKEEKVNMKRLFRSGNKCIATVVDTSLEQPDIKQITHIAMFRIQYKFNVVIAGETREIFHSVLTSHDITRTLKPGDAFPILYDVTQSKRAKIFKKVDVTSMPFPVPIKETNLLYVCCSTMESAL